MNFGVLRQSDDRAPPMREDAAFLLLLHLISKLAFRSDDDADDVLDEDVDDDDEDDVGVVSFFSSGSTASWPF